MSSAARIEDDEEIHRMDTLPPPEGEDDAYNAATKIGSMSRGLVQALMADAQDHERSPAPPRTSVARELAIPKPGRMPRIGLAPVSSPRSEFQRTNDVVDEPRGFDPTKLFAGTESDIPQPSESGTRSIIDELDGRGAQPRRSDAAWTKAPTLLAMSVSPLPATTALAPLLEPVSRRGKRPSTFAVELAIFLATFVLLGIPAVLAYFRWMR